ncbi:hypothetical protein GDO78_015451, partial [Eleutherodactylus coqui]
MTVGAPPPVGRTEDLMFSQQVLHQTFPQHTFLMNGLIHGVKGLLSFLSAPLIGALSDVWGRKSFLLLTVFFTCAPIPLLKISPWYVRRVPDRSRYVCRHRVQGESTDQSKGGPLQEYRRSLESLTL